MRITSDDQDKLAYCAWAIGCGLDILLDGRSIDGVVTADDDGGYVISYNDELETYEVLAGKVEFVPQDERGEKLLAALRKRWEILAPQW